LRVAEIAACDKGLTILESFGTPDDLWLRSGAARSAAVFCGGANSRPRLGGDLDSGALAPFEDAR
jgi:hypothetical protein